MKIYRVSRGPGGVVAKVQSPDGTVYDLPPRHDLRNHSPDGFNFGYGGSGPAQLALALLADATSKDDLALEFYHSYKWAVVGHHKATSWQTTDEAIQEWIARRAAAEISEG